MRDYTHAHKHVVSIKSIITVEVSHRTNAVYLSSNLSSKQQQQQQKTVLILDISFCCMPIYVSAAFNKRKLCMHRSCWKIRTKTILYVSIYKINDARCIVVDTYYVPNRRKTHSIAINFVWQKIYLHFLLFPTFVVGCKMCFARHTFPIKINCCSSEMMKKMKKRKKEEKKNQSEQISTVSFTRK